MIVVMTIAIKYISWSHLLRDRDHHRVRDLHHGQQDPGECGLLGGVSAGVAGVGADGPGGGPLLG